MAENDKMFAGSIPEIYDRYLVPLIFQPYAQDLVERAARIKPHDVLETAAGTGAVTRTLVAQLDPGVTITATDLNQSMLDRAMAMLGGKGQVRWQQADALALPFADASFDVVVCQFGAMFFPDKVKGYAEARRVLKGSGRFLFNVWDAIPDNDFAAVANDTLAELFPNDPPRFMARTPHGYHDAARIRAELEQAGFRQVAIETVTHRSRAASARDVAVAYCQGTPLRNEIESRDATLLDKATDLTEAAIRQRFGAGAVEGKIQALVISAGA